MISNVSSVLTLAVIVLFKYVQDRRYQKQQRQRQRRSASSSSSSSNSRRISANTIESDWKEQLTALTTNTTATMSESLLEDSDDNDSNDNNTSVTPLSSSSSSSSASSTDRMVWLLWLIYLGVLFWTALSVLIPSIPPLLFAVTTLTGLILCGICQSVLAAGVLARAGSTETAVHSYFAGQATGGLLVALMNLLTASTSRHQNPTEYQQRHHCVDDMANQHEYSSSANATDAIYTTQRILSTAVTSNTATATCVPYTRVHWTAFAYFALGCVVIVCCLYGWNRIVQCQSLPVETALQDTYTDIEAGSDTDNVTNEYDDDDEQEIGYPQGKAKCRNNNPHGNNSDYDNDSMCENSSYLSVSDTSKTQSDVSGSMLMMPTGSMDIGDSDDEQHRDEQDRQGPIVTILRDENHDHQHAQQLPQPSQPRHSVETDIPFGSNETMTVCWALRWNILSLFATYLCTLTLFPVWTAELTSAHPCDTRQWRLLRDLYTPLTFVIFNGGDLLGRCLSSHVATMKTQSSTATRTTMTTTWTKPRTLAILSWLRCLVFAILFLWCPARHNSWAPLHSNLYSIAVQLAFATTNGLLNSLCFDLDDHTLITTATATTTVSSSSSSRLQEKASEVLNLSLSLGLLAGSFVSFPYFRFAAGQW